MAEKAKYLVSEYAPRGQGFMNEKTWDTPEQAVKDINDRQKISADAKARGLAGNTVELHAVEPREGSRPLVRALNGTERAAIVAADTALKSGVEKGVEKGIGAAVKKEVVAVAEQVAEHGRKFGVAGRAAGVVVAAGLAMAEGANAAEVSQAAGNAVAPGLGTGVRAAVGGGPQKDGMLCHAFAEAAGGVTGFASGMVVSAGLTATGVGAVAAPAAGIATGIAVDKWATARFSSLCGPS